MKTILITGASGGLGLAVTNHFLNKGYRVLATVSSEDSKETLPKHEQLEAEVVDLTNEQATTAWISKAIEKHIKIDAALLLVGGFAMGNIANTKLEDIKKQISINFDTAYTVIKPVFEHMLRQNSGRIILIGSRPALKPADGKNMIAYSLSKSLVFQLAEYLNEEAKGKNVTATVVVPSTIDTVANRKAMPKADFDSWAKPESIAEVLEFVCSDQSSVLRETVLKVYNNA